MKKVGKHWYSEDLNTKLVWYSNGQRCLIAKWSSSQMPFEYRTSESSAFRCFPYSDVRYSDPHCTYKIVMTQINMNMYSLCLVMRAFHGIGSSHPLRGLYPPEKNNCFRRSRSFLKLSYVSKTS